MTVVPWVLESERLWIAIHVENGTRCRLHSRADLEFYSVSALSPRHAGTLRGLARFARKLSAKGRCAAESAHIPLSVVSFVLFAGAASTKNCTEHCYHHGAPLA